jgi:creatinine amidohydrolase
MIKNYVTILSLFFVLNVFSQELSYRLEELTAPDFVQAVEKSGKTCIIPIGVMEKHGAQLPLGTDLYMAREYALRAAEQEYTVVFPWYYFSQINEARHQPGTISYSPELIWKVLQETLDELNRNGFEKIILVNGHGGNNAFLNYFGMAQLSEPRNYTLYWFRPERSRDVREKAEALTQPDRFDSHAGNSELFLHYKSSLFQTKKSFLCAKFKLTKKSFLCDGKEARECGDDGVFEKPGGFGSFAEPTGAGKV